MTMADIWLTDGAQAAFRELQAAAPRQAVAVAAAIDGIPSKPGRRFRIPDALTAQPFLAIEPEGRETPVVIYRHAIGEEKGKWLVVALMDRSDYRATLRAEEELVTYPPSVQALVRKIVDTVAGSVATAHPGTVTISQSGGQSTDE
jgi:hypothetical protein